MQGSRGIHLPAHGGRPGARLKVLKDDKQRLDCLVELVVLVDQHKGSKASFQALRDLGLIPLLCSLLSSPSSDVHTSALVILGNLLSKDVDPGCAGTADIVRSTGNVVRVADHLFSDDSLTRMYASGAMMDLCVTPEDASQLIAFGGVQARLVELAKEATPTIRRPRRLQPRAWPT